VTENKTAGKVGQARKAGNTVYLGTTKAKARNVGQAKKYNDGGEKDKP